MRYDEYAERQREVKRDPSKAYPLLGKEREYRLIDQIGEEVFYICTDGKIYKKKICAKKQEEVTPEYYEGRMRIQLSSGYRYVEELVCQAFFRHYHLGTPIEHIDGNITNCSARNLTFAIR